MLRAVTVSTIGIWRKENYVEAPPKRDFTQFLSISANTIGRRNSSRFHLICKYDLMSVSIWVCVYINKERKIWYPKMQYNAKTTIENYLQELHASFALEY